MVAPPTASSATVLLTGTTGFVGGKLIDDAGSFWNESRFD